MPSPYRHELPSKVGMVWVVLALIFGVVLGLIGGCMKLRNVMKPWEREFAMFKKTLEGIAQPLDHV